MITEINKHGRQPEKLVPTITIETTFIVTREYTQKTNKLKMKTTLSDTSTWVDVFRKCLGRLHRKQANVPTIQRYDARNFQRTV